MGQQYRYQGIFLRKFFQQQWMFLLLGIVLTLAVLGVWQELLREELQTGVKSSLPNVVLFGGVIGTWTLAFSIYLGQRSERYVQQAKKVTQQLQQEILERQRIETELRSREASIRNLSTRLELAVESAQIGIWDWDIVADHLIWNDQMYTLYGVEPVCFLGVYEAWKCALHSDDFEMATAAIQQAIRGEKDYQPEFRVVHPDGTIRYIQAYAVVQRDAQGQAYRMIGVNFDVTDRKQAELVLQQSESTLRSFFNNESMLMGIVELHDHDVLHLSDNRTAANFFGTTQEAMRNRLASEMGVPQSHLKQWIQAYREAARTQASVRFEYLHQTSTDQRWLGASVCQIASDSSQNPRFSYIVEDITERKQTELALKKEILRSKTLLDISIDGIVTLDHKGNVVQTSLSFAQMIGYSIEETIKLNVSDWDSQWTKEELQNRLKGNVQVPPVFETWHRRKDGSIYDVEISYSRAELDGEIIHFCICRDISERKQSEAEIAHLAAIIESSEDAVISKSLEGTVTSWNAAAEKLFGYTAAEMVGQPARVLIPETLIGEERSILERIRHGESVRSYDTQRRRKDGRLIDVSIGVSPIKDAKGTITGASQIARDIRDRKRIEAERQRIENALRKSESRFQAFMNHSPATAWITDVNGTVLYASQTYVHTFQLPTTELIGKSIFELYPSEVAQQFLDNIQTVAQTQQIHESFEFAPRTNGTMGDFWVYKFPVPDESDQILVGGVAIDVTRQHQAEEALKLSEERLQLALEASGDGLWDWDVKTGKVYLNALYQEMLGYLPGELVMDISVWETMIHPDDKPRVLEHLQNHLQNISVQYSFDYRVRCKSGKWKWIADYGKVVARDKQENPLRMIGTHRDISDRKHKEAVLQQAIEAAETANLAKSMFLANMSHELRTPLNVILGFAQIMSHDSSLTPDQQEDLQTICRSGDHLLSLINDVLDLAKIEAGHCALEEAGFDLISLLHALRTMMAEQAEVKQLQLTFEIAPEVPQFVITDEQKLRQILLNLLSNAIKFTRQGGVTLRVTCHESQNKICSAMSSSHNESDTKHLISSPSYRLQFEVIDTGVGIPTEHIETIFDAFTQAEAGRKSLTGTGLGLTISRKLVELMDGNISVHSTLNLGSTFTVTIPSCPTSGVDTQPKQNDRIVIGLVPGQPHHRILVVEDQPDNRLLMVRLLRQIGLEVREATNGQEAIQIWQEWQPDLTWMDIRMPEVNGYETTKQIRAMEKEQASIIIALTAQASQNDLALALAAGCNDYISKPFRRETVLLKLAEYLGLEYLYEEPLLSTEAELSWSHQSPDQSAGLSALSLPSLLDIAGVPQTWLRDLEEATIRCDDQAVMKLVNQLPPECSQLVAYLTKLTRQYDFDQIFKLLRPNFSI